MACERWPLYQNDSMDIWCQHRDHTLVGAYGFDGAVCMKCFKPMVFQRYYLSSVCLINSKKRSPESIWDHPNYQVQCPECGNKIKFTIDVNIAPMIAELNRKGYNTVYCCEGHYVDMRQDKDIGKFIDTPNEPEYASNLACSSYIAFKKFSLHKILSVVPLPGQWKAEIDNSYIEDYIPEDGEIIKIKYPSKFTIRYERGYTTIRARMRLLRFWVDALPDINLKGRLNEIAHDGTKALTKDERDEISKYLKRLKMNRAAVPIDAPRWDVHYEPVPIKGICTSFD